MRHEENIEEYAHMGTEPAPGSFKLSVHSSAGSKITNTIMAVMAIHYGTAGAG